MTGKVPFNIVYLHGMVLDPKAQKMSKSKGNVIDPMTLTEKYGTDAFRIAMIVGNTPGTSLALSEDKIRGYKNFANKIWNITRFVLENQKSGESETKKNVIEEFENIKKDITADMENYRFYLASEKIYHYIWHKFADEIIEQSKKDDDMKKSLLPIWQDCLKILHPFTPFVTEEIWSMMSASSPPAGQAGIDRPDQKNLLIAEKWPC